MSFHKIQFLAKKSLMIFRMRFPQAILNLSGAEGFFLESKWQKNLNKHLSYSSCTFSAQSELQLDCQNWDDNLMNCLLFSI